MRPFFTYFGAKWRAAKWYPRPTHATIVEPFAGAAGYSLHWPKCRVILCDMNPIIAGIWDYLIHVSQEEILALPDLEIGQSTDDLGIPQEAKWLIGFWLNGSVASPCKRPSGWMLAGEHGSYWGERARRQLAWQVPIIRHWQIYCCQYYELSDIEATWFVDPPYEHHGKHYKFSSAGIDFEYLAAWCRSRTGQTIVCENAGATWLPFEPLIDRVGKCGREVKDVVWIQEQKP